MEESEVKFNIPPLTFYGPDCPLCGTELVSGDGWVCPYCGLCWTYDGKFADRLDDSVSQCLVRNHVNESYFCVRNVKHSGLHAGVSFYGLVCSWSDRVS